MTVHLITAPRTREASTRLRRFVRDRADVVGLVVTWPERGPVWLDLASGGTQPLAVVPSSVDYRGLTWHADATRLAWARLKLSQAMVMEHIDWLVIDGVGARELYGGGLEPTLRELFNVPRERPHIVLSTTDRLLPWLTARYNLRALTTRLMSAI